MRSILNFMKNKVSSSATNYIKWLLGIGLALFSALINSYFGSEPLFYRVLAIIFILVLAFIFIFSTAEGASALKIILESRNEIKRVIWPTRSETTSTSFIVIGVVTIAGLILWGLDSLFSWATASILG
jgi:preprotein translocase subunit SecE|tara:strand:- start:335 stop:718 length:384 start_codon:yes stop_codon:yes gene_type:complete